ncbi:MAG: hypothetical protein ACT6U0_16170 [Shinella sp.]|uniref:hypothetical protein n=1 Tax=Shinella sp. TaxID=1870904 RepID=UPI00403587BF
MSDCDSLNPLFWDIEKRDKATCRPRRHPRPSFVEALAVVIVLLLALVGGLDRWASDAKAGVPAAVTALGDAESG